MRDEFLEEIEWQIKALEADLRNPGLHPGMKTFIEGQLSGMTVSRDLYVNLRSR